MEAAIVFLLCAAAVVSGQILNPISTMMGMGTGWGNSMWHSGMRYPGMMQTSQVNSMTYPTWRTHPLFRMVPAVSEKKVESNLPTDIINVAKVPSSQEVLTHMALAVQNPKPYVDTITDFLYEPQKARTVLTPFTGLSSGMPSGLSSGMSSGLSSGMSSGLSSGMSSGLSSGMSSGLSSGMSSGLSSGMSSGLSSGIPVGSVSLVSTPTYSQGMNMMKANIEDCGPDGMRWARGLDWLY